MLFGFHQYRRNPLYRHLLLSSIVNIELSQSDDIFLWASMISLLKNRSKIHAVWHVWSLSFFSCLALALPSTTLMRSGADPGFFLGGGALVSCSTSTPINHIVFLQNTSCIRKPQVILGGGVRTPCTLPLDPPLTLVWLAWLYAAIFGPTVLMCQWCFFWEPA